MTTKILDGPGALPFGTGLGQGTVAAIGTGDNVITIHGTANWIVTPAGTREIALLIVDVSNNNFEIVLPLLGFITHAAGDQIVPVLRAGNLPPGEVVQTQTAKAFNANSQVYQMVTPGLIDAMSSGAELDHASSNVAQVTTVTTGSVNDTFAHSTLIQNMVINPTFSGIDPMMIEGFFYLYISGTITAGTSKMIVSLADTTAGGPGAGAVEVGQVVTPFGAIANAIYTFFVKVPLGTPPAGTRSYAAYMWGNTPTGLVLNAFASSAANVPYTEFLRVVQE